MSIVVNDTKCPSHSTDQASPPAKSPDDSSFFDSPVLLARLAYQIWEQSGRPDQQEECWSQAEDKLRRPRFLN